MTREQCDLLSAPLVRTVNDMEDEILRVIAAQLAKDGNISDTSKWRIRQLARSGEMDKETARIIARYSGLEEGFAMAAIEDAAKIEMGYVDNAVRGAGLAALANGGEAAAEMSVMNAYSAFQRQAKSTLNLVNTVMMYKAKQTFVNGVNKIYFESEKSRQNALNSMGKYSAGTVMGQFSLQEATRRCIKEMAGKGIPAFVDKRGREWSPEAYVMMDMRSTLGNTARAAQWARCDEYGIKLVEVSSHLGARPGCAPYQGRIFSRDGSSGTTTDGAGNKITYTPLSQTSYGKPDGLFGINCGHVQYPFFPGCSFQSYFPYPKEENAEMYKNHQKQRYYERQIRAAKRECVMLNETGDAEGFKAAAARLKRNKESYKKFTESKGLYLHNDRTQVVGFDRSVSGKATWANRKAEQAKASAAAVKAGGVPTGGKGSSGGHAVTVTPPRDPVVGNSAKVYRDTKSGLTEGGNGGIIKERFNSISDPMFEVTGSAYTSHPQEVQNIIDRLKEWGVEINYTDSLGYGSPSVGNPGGMSITRNASYSAWLHEFQHVKDAKENGWDGARVLFEDFQERIRREKRAYQIEIDLALQYNRPDIAKRLEENLNDEIRKINEFFGIIT